MLSTPSKNIIKETEKSLNEEERYVLYKRLDKENYDMPFNILSNWALQRRFVFNQYKLISEYIHPLDQEPFDEN